MKRIFSAVLAVILLLGCASCKKEEPNNAGKTISFHLSAEPLTLDPQIAADDSAALTIQAIFEGLARLDENGDPTPGVAESWTSDSGSTSFTFTLRGDAQWSDKTPVTAGDFVFAFRRALSPATGSTVCRPMFCIKNAREVNAGSLPPEKLGVTAKDARTLVVDLAYPYPDFPALTATAPFMPCNETFFEKASGKYGLEYQFILSNGPFIINGKYGWDHGKYLRLARSDTYAGERRPLPLALSFSIGDEGPDLSNPLAALADADVDAAALPESLVDKAEAAGLSVTSFQDSTWGLCFNTQDDLMKSLNLRKGFVQSFSREKVMAFLPEKAEPADSIIGPDTRIFGRPYRELADGAAFFAKQDDKAAGFFAAGLKELDLDEFPSVTVLCPDDENVKRMVNEMLVAWNQNAGSYLSMEPLPEDELLQRVADGNYQIALSQVPSGGGRPLSNFQSDSGSNPARLKSGTFDSLLAKAEQSGVKEAAAAYAEVQNFLSGQCVFYPIYYKKSYYACAKGVTGIVFHPDSAAIDFIGAGKE